MKQICILLSAFLVLGCSNAPLGVQPVKESYRLHDGKTCGQLGEEYRDAVARRKVLTELQARKVQDESHAGSMLLYAVPTFGLSVLLGLAEFADNDYKDELAKSKGAVVSLEEVMFRDGCEISP